MSVHLTGHALLYIGDATDPGSRTSLKAGDITHLLEFNAFLRLGSRDGTNYDLVWDHHREEAIVLLTTPDLVMKNTVVISVWPIHFGMPVATPSAEKINEARRRSERLWSRTQA